MASNDQCKASFCNTTLTCMCLQKQLQPLNMNKPQQTPMLMLTQLNLGGQHGRGVAVIYRYLTGVFVMVIFMVLLTAAVISRLLWYIW